MFYSFDLILEIFKLETRAKYHVETKARDNISHKMHITIWMCQNKCFSLMTDILQWIDSLKLQYMYGI